MLKISIVTPSFNQAGFLEKTILSVLSQNYSELEYVVMDGGSTDESAAIISKYSEELHYWVSEKDNGHADALNKGFGHCSGEIMAWLNSDDMYMPGAFSIVNEIFETFPEVQWITGLSGFWDRRGRLTDVDQIYKNAGDYLIGNPKYIQQESTFWRRSLWEAAGQRISNNYRYMIDGELWSRFFRHADLYHVNTVLSGYRWHGENRAQAFVTECDLEFDNIIRDMRSCFTEYAVASADARVAAIANYQKLINRGRLGRYLAKRFRYKHLDWFQRKYHVVRYLKEKETWVKYICIQED